MYLSYITFYNAIIKNNIINKIDSIYWLYSIENLIVKHGNKDKRYLKVYFFNRCLNEHHNLTQLQVKFHGENISIEDFQVAQQFNDPNIMGFVHEIELSDTSSDLKIVSYIIDGSCITPSGLDLESFTINRNEQKVHILNDFIFKGKSPIQLYPHIEAYYWSCCCGFINSTLHDVCPICGRTIHDNEQLLDIDLEKVVLQDLTKHVNINDRDPIDQQIDLFCKDGYQKYGISQNALYNHLDKAQLRKQQEQIIQKKVDDYISCNHIEFDLSQTYEANIDHYIKPLCNKVILKEDVLTKIDQEATRKQYSDAIQKQYIEEKRKKRNLIIMGSIGGVLCIALIAALVLHQPSKIYQTAAHEPDDTVLPTDVSREVAKGGFNTLSTKDEPLSAGVYSSIAIKKDHTVMATPIRNESYNDGQADVLQWNDIQFISSGQYHTVGLRNDGTVISSMIKNKANDVGQTVVQDWKNIKQVAVSTYHSVALKEDGTVISTKINNANYDFGQTETSEWKDIVEIAAGYDHTIGLKRDGTVVATKIKNADFDYGETNIEGWSNIVNISTGSNHTLGLKSDGTVVAVGYQGDDRCNVSNWRDIAAISAGRYHSIGLQKDGKVIATSKIDQDSDFGQNQIQNWSNIIQVSAGWYHTLGLRSDGTIVSTNITKQDGNVGQLEINNWQLEVLHGR